MQSILGTARRLLLPRLNQARRTMNNFAAFGLTLLFGVVGFVWLGGSSSKESDSGAMPVSLVEHRKPELVSVNIEDIRQGDYVLAKDPITGEVAERKVLQAFARVSDHLRVLTLRSESGDEQRISTTDEHPFFIEGDHERKAGNLSIGDKVVQADGQFAVLIDTHREEHKAGLSVYNFEVEGFHTYFVSAQGARAPPVWVHNASYGSIGAADLPWARACARQAARAIEAGQTSIKMSSRDDAAELIWRMFRSQGYTDTTMFGSGSIVKQYLGTKANTYHWDDLVDASGNLAGHGSGNAQGAMRHVQIHLAESGKIIRIFFP